MTAITPLPSNRPLNWPEIVYKLQMIFTGMEVYLVGGTVRDIYLQRPVHDLDLVTPGDGRPLARRIADTFGGDYYPLDAGRKVGRALVEFQGQPWTIDVAQFRGATLFEDLADRDFTVNAIAVDLRDLEHLLDPLQGAAALEDKLVTVCGPDSIAHDPVRALRAVRMSLMLKSRLSAEARAAIRQDGAAIKRASPERLRDEIFKLLDLPKPSAGLMVLDTLGLLAEVFPEAAAMQGVEQSPPHTLDVWRHTLSVMDFLDSLLASVGPARTDSTAANFALGALVLSLGPLRARLQTHLEHAWPNHRSHRALLMLAALLHDVAKPLTRTVEEDGRFHFYGHAEEGELIAAAWAEALRLSNEESHRLQLIVRHHIRPVQLNRAGKVTRRAQFRFWRDLGEAGVDVCLLSLADYLGTYGSTLNQDAWLGFVETVTTLLDAYYNQPDELVNFPALLDGKTLMRHFDLEPGPLVGEVLEALREAQAVKEVQTQEEALVWVAQWLEEALGGR